MLPLSGLIAKTFPPSFNEAPTYRTLFTYAGELVIISPNLTFQLWRPVSAKTEGTVDISSRRERPPPLASPVKRINEQQLAGGWGF
eukprot:1722399-Pyramimonas_sp.AAC.2